MNILELEINAFIVDPALMELATIVQTININMSLELENVVIAVLHHLEPVIIAHQVSMNIKVF
jgi:hypothetical protein